MMDVAWLALATFFATVGPVDVAAMFAVWTVDQSPKQKRLTAVRGVLIATGILVTFALVGDVLLARLGISIAALSTGGGILLLLIGIEMVFARSSGGTSTTQDEAREAIAKTDISVFPLATPMIAGPGAMGAAVLLMANQSGNLSGQIMVIAGILAVMLFTLLCLLLATEIQRWLGVTGMHVITRVMGVLLTALAVQFIFNGIRQSGLLG
ncbi:MAG: MarC family protein [Ketobacter sp.]|nr:MAG: MarC family protein [Ketobacter sp.]